MEDRTFSTDRVWYVENEVVRFIPFGLAAVCRGLLSLI